MIRYGSIGEAEPPRLIDNIDDPRRVERPDSTTPGAHGDPRSWQSRCLDRAGLQPAEVELPPLLEGQPGPLERLIADADTLACAIHNVVDRRGCPRGTNFAIREIQPRLIPHERSDRRVSG